MERLILRYVEATPGVPLLAVCGLSLVKRAVLTAGKAGVKQVVLVLHPADEAAVRAELDDKRVTAPWTIEATPDEAGATVMEGDRVFLKDALTGHNPDAWRPVTGPAGIPAAEDLLIESLAKPADGFIARHLNRKLSGPISRRLAPYKVHPNHVSAVVCLIGVLSYPLNALGTWAGFALGGLCYYLSSVLDGVDGELSRLKYLGSPLGAWVDTIVDDVVGTAYLAGLYLGLYRQAGSTGMWHWVGITAIVLYFLTILPRYWLMITQVGVGDHQAIAAQRLEGEKGPIGKLVDFLASKVFRLDFLVFMAFVLSVIGQPGIYGAIFAIGAALSFGETVYTVAQLRRTKA